MKPRPADWLMTAGLLACVLAAAAASSDPFPWPVAAMVVPLAWRRVQPFAVCVLCAVGLSATTLQPMTRSLLVIVTVALITAAFSSAVHSRRWPWAGPAVLAVALAPLAGHMARLPFSTGEVPFLVIGAAALAGVALRAQAQKAATAQAAALSADRARIARELHDVVTHRVTLMVVAAGAARMLVAEPDGPAAAQLKVIESGGRQALNELRGLLGLLAATATENGLGDGGNAVEGDGAPLGPLPGVADLDALFASMRGAGLPVRSETTGTAYPLSPGLDLTVYRIVQEALTNALRHSTRAGTSVSIAYEPGRLRVRVTDDQPAPDAARTTPGRGLAGIRERVGVYGGTLTTGPRPGHGFRVSAELPLPPENTP
jgi:signal transduction histidine kinase